jgi:hypothetical protein
MAPFNHESARDAAPGVNRAEFPALRRSNGNPLRKVWPRTVTRCDVPCKENGTERREETPSNAAQNGVEKGNPRLAHSSFINYTLGHERHQAS